jgi:hypothetical protein
MARNTGWQSRGHHQAAKARRQAHAPVGGKKGGTRRGKDPTFVLAERSPAGVEEGDVVELPSERRLECRLCSHPGLMGEAVVMAAGRGGGEGGERWWQPSLRPKRKRWMTGMDGARLRAPGKFIII